MERDEPSILYLDTNNDLLPVISRNFDRTA